MDFPYVADPVSRNTEPVPNDNDLRRTGELDLADIFCCNLYDVLTDEEIAALANRLDAHEQWMRNRLNELGVNVFFNLKGDERSQIAAWSQAGIGYTP